MVVNLGLYTNEITILVCLRNNVQVYIYLLVTWSIRCLARAAEIAFNYYGNLIMSASCIAVTVNRCTRRIMGRDESNERQYTK